MEKPILSLKRVRPEMLCVTSYFVVLLCFSLVFDQEKIGPVSPSQLTVQNRRPKSKTKLHVVVI